MKKILLLMLMSLGAWAQNGIAWEKDINKALEKAKADNKLLFVEAYLPTCPACQALEPYLKNEQVGKGYNQSFINYKLDLGPMDGARKFLDERKIYIPSFPQFLFFDGNGNLVHQSEVLPSVESILSVKDDALNPENRTENYKNRFDKGERSQDFLLKYGVYTQLIKDTLMNKSIADEMYRVFDKTQLASINSWSITKKIVNTTENGFFKYWINNIGKAAEFEKQAGHPGGEMNTFGKIVQSTIFDPESKKYSLAQVNDLKNYMSKIGAAQYVDSYLWEHEILANLREGNSSGALEVASRIFPMGISNGNYAIYIAKILNDNFKDTTYLSLVRESLKAAQSNLKSNSVKPQYYYELARVELKAGQNELAKKYLNEAVEWAKKEKLSFDKYEEILKTL